MPEKENIKIAIIGATSTFKGFGENIGSSAAFSDSLKDVKAISELDKEFSAFYERYPEQYGDMMQLYFFPRIIADTVCFLGMRGKKKFTAFPEQNRFYDRREYFYFDRSVGIDPVSFAASLPDMIPLPEKRLGQINTFTINALETPPAGNLIKNIMASLLDRNTLAISIKDADHPDIERRLMYAFSSLPGVIKKYLGFAFNIKGDEELVRNYIHLYTSLETDAVDLVLIERMIGKEDEDLYNFLVSTDNRFDDTEIELLSRPVGRDTLFELLAYHRLHFETDKYIAEPQPERISKSFIKQLRGYLDSFMNRRFLENSHVFRRIMQIYRCWVANDMITPDIFIDFWNRIHLAGVRHARLYEDAAVRRSIDEFIEYEGNATMHFKETNLKYGLLATMPSPNNSKGISVLEEIQIRYFKDQGKPGKKDILEAKDLEIFRLMIKEKAGIDFKGDVYDAVDFKEQSGTLSADENFELLSSKIEGFSDDKIFSLINNIGLQDLYARAQSKKGEKFLQHNNFTGPVLELLGRNKDLGGLVNWLTLFKVNHASVSFSMPAFLERQADQIDGAGDFKLFNAFGRVMVANRDFFDSDTIATFIRKILDKKPCRRKEFYDDAFIIAKVYGISINVYAPQVETDQELTDWISYYEKNQQQISNPDLVTELSQKLMNNLKSKPFGLPDILLFTLSNPSFAQSNADGFYGLVETAIQREQPEKKEALILLLLEAAVSQPEGLFLKMNDSLRNKIENTPVVYRESIHRLYGVGVKAAKSENPAAHIIEQIADKLINNYFDKNEQQLKPFAKMKNKIAFVSKGLKNAVIILIIAVAGLSVMCFNLFLQNRSLEDRVTAMEKTNSELTDQNKALIERSKPVQPAVKQDSTLTASLLPAPNRELTAHDVGVVSQQTLKGKPAIDIVGIIFSKNPTDIASQYHDQSAAYAAELIRLNPDCFKKDTCTCMSLAHIPSYKASQ